MKLNIETRNGLERCIKIELSEDHFKKNILEQLQLLDENLKIENISSIQNIHNELALLFNTEIRDNIIYAVMNLNLSQALCQTDFKIAGVAVFNNMIATADNGFIFDAIFETYPSIPLPDLKSHKFTQLVAEIHDEDIDNTISILRRQQEQWCAVERPAQLGDSVFINYHAQVGDKVFDGNSMRVELNGNDDVDGFESGLIGVSAGEKLALELTFPDEHYQAEVAGKSVIFDVEALRVEERKLPELDADFIRSHSAEDGKIETLRHAIQHNMNRHLQSVTRMKNTLAIFTDILKKAPIEQIPQALVDEEIKRQVCDPCEEVEGVESFKHDIDPTMFNELAHDRVRKSLMIDKLASENGIKLDTKEVRIRLEDLVEEYSDKDLIIEWFYEDKVRLAGIESDVLGEQVADWIFANSDTNKVITDYSEMMNFSGMLNS